MFVVVLDSNDRPDSEGDRRYANACRSGDRDALDRFFREHVTGVERTIFRVVGPTPDLEDLVQATFVEAIRSFPAYRGEASMAAWVTRIATHVSYHYLRGRPRRFASLELVTLEDDDRYIAPSPDVALDSRRITGRLTALLDQITPKKRVAFALFAVLGHSVEEVAAYTGASITAVKSRLLFARRELQQLIKADPELSVHAARLLRGEAGVHRRQHLVP